MRVGLAAHQERVSPVLDVARRLLVVDVEGARELSRHEAVLAGATCSARVAAVRESGVQVLICGAVSRPLEIALVNAGVRLIPRVCGPTDEVLGAFLAGRLKGTAYLMPGCCRRRRQQRRTCDRGQSQHNIDAHTT